MCNLNELPSLNSIKVFQLDPVDKESSPTSSPIHPLGDCRTTDGPIKLRHLTVAYATASRTI